MRHTSSGQTWTLTRLLIVLSALVLLGALANVSVASNVASPNPENPERHNTKPQSITQPARERSPSGPFSDVPAANLQQYPNQNNQQTNKALRYLAKVLDDPLAVLTVILIGVLVWHAVLFRGTLIESKESAEQQLRAYIGTKKATVTFVARITGPGAIPPKFVASVLFVNAGQTPAHEVTNQIGMTIARYPLKTTLPPTTLTSGVMTVMPHIEWTQKSGDDLSEEQVKMLDSADNALWVYGRIDYKIVFGRRKGQRDTKTSHYRFFKEGPVQFGPTSEMHTDEDGNQAD